jgi:hypothetical protein
MHLNLSLAGECWEQNIQMYDCDVTAYVINSRRRSLVPKADGIIWHSEPALY